MWRTPPPSPPDHAQPASEQPELWSGEAANLDMTGAACGLSHQPPAHCRHDVGLLKDEALHTVWADSGEVMWERAQDSITLQILLPACKGAAESIVTCHLHYASSF